MTTTIETLLALASIGTVLHIVAVAARTISRRPFAKRLEKYAITEKHRNAFGALRTELVAKMRAGEVDPRKDVTLAGAYSFLTVMMRSPDMYKEAASAFTVATASEKRPRPLERERRSAFTQEFGRKMVEAIDELCRDFLFGYRWFSRVADMLNKLVSNHRKSPTPLFIAMAFSRRRRKEVEEFERDISPVREAFAAKAA